MTCSAFVAQSFAVRTSAHLLHLSSRSYAQHVALGSFYEGLIGLVDSFVEIHMGLSGLIESWPTVSPPKGSPVQLLEAYLSLVKEQQAETKDQALMNILASIEELTAQTLYKLRFLK